MDKRILVIIDHIKYCAPALKQAGILAKHFNQNIELICFTYEHSAHIPLELSPSQLEQVKQARLGQTANELAEQLLVVNHETQIEQSILWHKYPSQWLSDDCDFSKYSMVIKTRHIDNQQQFSQLDWQLIRTSPLPVYLAADQTWRNNKNVFGSLDLASKKASKVALNQAVIESCISFAQMNQASAKFGYAVSISPLLRDLGFVYVDEKQMNALDNIPSDQQAILKQYQIINDVAVKAGPAEKVIPSLAADMNAGLVVIGSVGRKGLKGKLLGNTAEKILNLLKTDLLILTPEKE
ncbi:universal stress protein [Pseudoalteromonas tunicata]|uniref:universal stress protein n=1 Tax=Pseudoalteromonas tunicata TaxID=314281 RepID=UPI00273F6CD6|nr:universal stress protein [Pseudoalteromonas tunicata]MDP5213137.1 universal stress protein [Pseudoalteromonas tunicata]